jgi:hypothetical protein
MKKMKKMKMKKKSNYHILRKQEKACKIIFKQAEKMKTEA